LKREVAERKRAAQRARHHQAELARVGRIATMGELAAGLAHELNQPLCAIVTNAQAAQRQAASQPSNREKLHATLEDIVRDGKRAGQIINDIRNFLQHDQSELALLDVNELVREIVSFADADAGMHRARIKVELKTPLPPIVGDRVQIQQVVLNLIRNGLEAMDDNNALGHELTVTTGERADGMIEISVRDDGVGLSDDVHRRMFELFFTTKPRGLGVGLSISRSLIRAHGGRLWATSNPERGATFRIALPPAQEKPAP
jgi:signal transduction histidine kinase